ncbi:MAG: hypothetical protein HY909_10405 [Deltaproteobacteria bacterium]|nr:hypothetical protein [Deltaproteobacteria bacterium]
MRATSLLLGFSLALGCAAAPRPTYTFDPVPGGWELSERLRSTGQTGERFVHPVHTESLEFFEVQRPSPGTTAAEFGALAPASRTLPAFGEPTATPRTLGDDEIEGVRGFWVSQHGRVRGELLQAAAFVVPSGRRHFIVRMASADDDLEQLRGWTRDLLLRNARFPTPLR